MGEGRMNERVEEMVDVRKNDVAKSNKVKRVVMWAVAIGVPTAFTIALGKLGSAMAMVMMYMITSVPVMAIAFVLGGMNWWALFGLIGMMLYLGIYVGSVGIFCSSVVKKSIMATILTIVIGIGIIIVTLVIFAIGNAPTALVRLYELIQDGKLRPELIIGVPVGFVNVVQSKELIMQTDVPYIIARGRKGGSNVAAAICNAILYDLDKTRGLS